MSLETDVQELTQATTDLLVAVNVSKATLDGKVDDAGDFATASLNSANASAASASTATTQATAAGTARTGAEAARDAAVVAQNNAVAVVTGGTATLTPSAGKIPLSDAQGKIAKGWLTNTDLVEQTDIGTAPNEIPLNQFLGELAYLDAQNIPTLGINVANANTANVTNLMQVTEISNAVPSLNLDFAKVKQLDPRITFTRASTGTYYDGKTVAKAEENLLQFSQQFDIANWVKANSTVIADGVAAPDGTMTAELVTASAVTSTHYVQQNFTAVVGQVYTASVYAKAGTQNFIQIVLGADNPVANFNISTGVVGTTSSVISAAITAVGGGWYRCSVTYTSAVTSTSLVISLVTSSSAARIESWAAAGTENIFLWGAQLEQRSAATAYTPTTTQPITNYIPVLMTAASGVPRFEHNPVTGESLGLEIEEQRANLLTYSSEFDNAAWTKISTAITTNTVVAPDGALTGDKLASSTAIIASHQCYQISVAITNGVSYTWSVYMKQGEYAWGIVNAFSATDSRTYFNLANGTVGTVAAGATATITPVGNGWYRCTVTRTSAAITGGLSIEMTNADNVPSFAAVVGNGIYIWGAQLEAGAFPTSYIPTVASQVTRAADSAVMTGANFSSWYRQGEGTLYGEQVLGNIVQTNQPVVSIFSSVASGYLLVGQAVGGGSATGSALFVVNNGSSVAYIASASGIASIGSSLKSAAAYKVNDFAFTANAGSIGTSFLGLVPTVDRLQIGALQGIGTSNGTIRKITYYPQRLSNAELVEITA